MRAFRCHVGTNSYLALRVSRDEGALVVNVDVLVNKALMSSPTDRTDQSTMRLAAEISPIVHGGRKGA